MMFIGVCLIADGKPLVHNKVSF